MDQAKGAQSHACDEYIIIFESVDIVVFERVTNDRLVDEQGQVSQDVKDCFFLKISLEVETKIALECWSAVLSFHFFCSFP